MTERQIQYEVDLVNNKVLIILDLYLAKKIRTAFISACYSWNFPPHDLQQEMEEIVEILKKIEKEDKWSL